MNPPLEATHLRDTLWCVRPEGRCGTCGWIDGRAWTAQFVRATSAEDAIRKASTFIIYGRNNAPLQA
jgi:hypothetical protein